MNCLAARLTRGLRSAAVWLSSSTSTYRRPSKPRAFDLTSGATAVLPTISRGDRSTGMSTCEKMSTFCSLPSS